MNELGDSKFEWVTVPFSKALQICVKQISQGVAFKNYAPGYQTLREITGVKLWTQYQKTVASNCQRVRESVASYVRQRKSGERKSTVGEADLVSLCLNNPEVFDEDLIVDEILDFFGAGSATTSLT